MAPAPRPTDDPGLDVWKDQLRSLGIRELGDVMFHLGQPKQMKKKNLIDRAIALLSDKPDQLSKMKIYGKETVVEIIDKIYRKKYPKMTVSASKSQIESGQNVEHTNKSVDSAQLVGKVQCPCGTSMTNGPMIKVLNLVPKEQDGEKFSDAVARVRRCVGGGTDAGNADSDSDIEVLADSASVSLRCPLTGSRIKIAGRFKPCVHMGCFDLEAFVELNQRLRKWQCPICQKNYSLADLIIDPYFNRITSLVQSYDDAASEIDVKPDGSWRIKGAPELKDLSQWHSPDGTLCSASERDGSMGQANMDGRSEICHDGSADKRTSLSLGGADESLIHAQNASQKRMNTGDEIAASDASVLRSGNDGGLSGEIPGGPCSPHWPQRSVRPRLILTIDSDSD